MLEDKEEKEIAHLSLGYEGGDAYVTEVSKYFEIDWAGTEFETLLTEILYGLRAIGYSDALIKKYINLEF